MDVCLKQNVLQNYKKAARGKQTPIKEDKLTKGNHFARNTHIDFIQYNWRENIVVSRYLLLPRVLPYSVFFTNRSLTSACQVFEMVKATPL